MSRRSLLTRVGAAGGLLAMPDLMTPGLGAEPTAPGLGQVASVAARDLPLIPSAALPTLTPGVSYLVLDAFAFFPGDPATDHRTITSELGATTTAGLRLDASLSIPVGSVLMEVLTCYRTPSPASGPATIIFKKPLDGSVGSIVASSTLLEGSGPLNSSTVLAELFDGSASYSIQFFVGFSEPTAVLDAVRVGYVPGPQSFVPIEPVVRVLDTRLTDGKLNPNEERFVLLRGVPGFARAAVMNLTVTGTEAAGYVAVFAADKAWPGNSSINWFGDDQNLANSVVTAVDANGQIKIRGGVNRAHVVIDVQGYFV
jgi:hypothetical protein